MLAAGDTAQISSINPSHSQTSVALRETAGGCQRLSLIAFAIKQRQACLLTRNIADSSCLGTNFILSNLCWHWDIQEFAPTCCSVRLWSVHDFYLGNFCDKNMSFGIEWGDNFFLLWPYSWWQNTYACITIWMPPDLAHQKDGRKQVSSRWHSELSQTQACSSIRRRYPNNGTFAKKRKEIKNN